MAIPIVSNSLERGPSIHPDVRITAAGAFHNIILWAILMAVTRVTVFDYSHLWDLGGYGLWKDVTSLGPTVVDIPRVRQAFTTTLASLTSLNQDSPLKTHVPLSSIVTRLDDTHLASSGDGKSAWGQYLTADTAIVDVRGWCVSKPWFKGNSPPHIREQSLIPYGIPSTSIYLLSGLRRTQRQQRPMLPLTRIASTQKSRASREMYRSHVPFHVALRGSGCWGACPLHLSLRHDLYVCGRRR